LRHSIAEFRDLIDTINDRVPVDFLYKGFNEIRKFMKCEDELSRINA
jgi:hypothetical protein